MKPKATKDHFIEQIIDDPSYEIKSNGEIWTTRKVGTRRNSEPGPWRKIVTKNTGRSNYKTVKYYNTFLLAHRIVYRKYNGPLAPNMEINHIDGQKLNNDPKNLELVTASQNHLHRYRALNHVAPKSKAKITQEIAEEIRFEYENERITQTELGTKYGLDQSTIPYITRGATWVLPSDKKIALTVLPSCEVNVHVDPIESKPVEVIHTVNANFDFISQHCNDKCATESSDPKMVEACEAQCCTNFLDLLTHEIVLTTNP